MHPWRHCQAGWPWLCEVLGHRTLQEGQQERIPAFCGSAEVPSTGTVSSIRAAGQMIGSMAFISLPLSKLPVCSVFLCRPHFLHSYFCNFLLSSLHLMHMFLEGCCPEWETAVLLGLHQQWIKQEDSFTYLPACPPSPDISTGLLPTPARVWCCCLVLWFTPSLLPCSSSYVHTADASAKASSICACPSRIPLLILEHLSDFRSFWILLLSFSTCRPSQVDVLCIPTHIPWVISKNIRQPPFTAVCSSPFYTFFPDTQRMLFILCRFLNKACNLITEVHLRVFSPCLRVRMPFATYVMMLIHLVMLSKKETGLLHTIYSW